MNHLSLVAIFKNESLYIKEWLCYYYYNGVDSFYLYDDSSEDDYLKEINSLPFKNKIKIFLLKNFVKKNNRQKIAYEDYIKNYTKFSNWTIFCDLDEFIIPLSRDKINHYIDNFESKDISGLGIFWHCYGSSFFEKRPTGLILENYLYRSKNSFGPNRHIKSIIKSSDLIGFITPHIFKSKNPIVDEKGTLIKISSNGYTDYHTSDTIKINHYLIKSKEDFLIKQKRGRATVNYSRPDSFFKSYDLNDVYDNSALKFVDPLKKYFYSET